MADIKITLDASQFEKAVKDLQAAIKGGAGGTGEQVEQAEKYLNKKKQILKLSETEKVQQQAFNREVKLQAQLYASSEGSINRMKASLALLLTQQGNLNRTIASEAALYKKNEQAIFNYRAQLKTLETQMNNHQRNVGNYLGAIRDGFAKAAIAIAGAVAVYRTLENVIGGSVKAFLAAEAAQNRLKIALNNNIPLFTRLAEEAKRLKVQFGIDDEDIMSIQAYLALQGRTEQQIMLTTRAAIAYSSFTGEDLRATIEKLDPIWEGNIGRLGKVESSWKDLLKESNGGMLILEDMVKRYGSFAEQVANSTEGKVRRMSIAWDDFKEALGGVIMTAGIPGFFDQLTGGLNRLNAVMTDENLSRWQKFQLLFNPTMIGYIAAQKEQHKYLLDEARKTGADIVLINKKTGEQDLFHKKLLLEEYAKFAKAKRWDEAAALKEGYFQELKRQQDLLKVKVTPQKTGGKTPEKAEAKTKIDIIKETNATIVELEKIKNAELEKLQEESNKNWEKSQKSRDETIARSAKGQAKDEEGVAKERKDIEKKTTQDKIEIAEGYYNDIDKITNGIGQLWESQRQKEIEGARGNQQKIAAINKEYGEREKLMAMAMATIQYAMGMVKIWAAEILVIPKAIADSAILTAQYGINMALIGSQKFVKGKIDIQGPGTETSDSILAFLSRGETVTPADKTKRYRPALEAIHKDRFEEYVYVNYVMPEMNREAKQDIDRGTAKNMYDSLKLNAVLDDLEIRRKIGESNLLLSKIVKNTKYSKNIIR